MSVPDEKLREIANNVYEQWLRGEEGAVDIQASILKACQQVAALSRVSAGASLVTDDLLDALAKHPNWELSKGDDGDEENYGWRVHRCTGNINDREWDLIAFAETPRAALQAALQQPEAGEKQSMPDIDWIAALIRNEYDPKPSHYKFGETGWDDRAEFIANKVIERLAKSPSTERAGAVEECSGLLALSDLIENDTYDFPPWLRTCLRGIRADIKDALRALAPERIGEGERG